jgi:hypothetical protein
LSDTLRLLLYKLFGMSGGGDYTDFGQRHTLTGSTLTELTPVFGKMSEMKRRVNQGVIIVYGRSRGLTAKAEVKVIE